MDAYTIYLVNTGADPQLFCCFLDRPQELASDPGVFANTEVSLQVTPHYRGLNRFFIPVQYAPQPTFYVATGNYGSNILVDWATMLNAAHAVRAPTDFRYGECTVTCDESGNLHVSPGKPATIVATANDTKTPADLVDRELGDGQLALLESVHFLSGPEQGSRYTSLTGNIAVAPALAAGLTFFVLDGVIFTIDDDSRGRTTVRFTYRGPESADTIKSLFKRGAALFLR